jgi:protein-S-isoprenylcysteine O-methyltransferase Ste14
MLRLEHKVPPLLLVLLFGVAMWFVSHVTPNLSLPNIVRLIVCALLAAAGIIVVVSGFLSFRRVGTTVNPTTPEASTSLVTTGIFRFTRNPMYVGMLLWLAALGSWLANPYSFAACGLFVLYMNRFQIGPEERALETLFGDSYRAYCARVRRWI